MAFFAPGPPAGGADLGAPAFDDGLTFLADLAPAFGAAATFGATLTTGLTIFAGLTTLTVAT